MSVSRRPRAALSRTLLTVGLAAAFSTACVGEVIDKSNSGPEDAPAPVAVTHFVRSRNAIPGKYIVVMNDAVTFAAGNDVRAMSAALAIGYRARVTSTFSYAMRGFSADMSEADAMKLAEDPQVQYVEEDAVVTIDTTQDNATQGIDRVDQRDLPLDKKYNFNADGTGVTAYVIDTGIRITHTEFGGRASVLTVNGVAFDAIGDGQKGIDCNGHGTHVAGTIGGKTFGLAKNVKLKAVRVLGCDGSGSNAGVIQGIDAVAKDAVGKGPAVANMSLGGGASKAVDDAVQRAIDAGVVFAVAAGNDSKPGQPADACNGSPSRAPNAITVGATQVNDVIAGFSDVGRCVDIFAPGVNITSAFAGSDTQLNTISGTSMATPHVAGVAALFLSANPTAKPAQVVAALTQNATPGKIKNGLGGSPDLLLFSGFIGGATPPPVTPPAPPPVTPPAGQARVGTASGTVGTGRTVVFQVPGVLAGSNFTGLLQGAGFGDVDLFIRIGAPATRTVFDCRSNSESSTETCSVKLKAGADQTVFVTVFGFIADDFDLQVNFTTK